MLKKTLAFMLTLLLILTLASCAPTKATSPDSEKDTSVSEENTPEETQAEEEGTTEVPLGDPVASFTQDWPTEMLPEGFPNLGKVSKVVDSSVFGPKITIYWNILTETEANSLVEMLNTYLDVDHAWQGIGFSDGIKYKPGSKDEFINIRIRWQPTATGAMEPEIDSQFFLEIIGEGLPTK